MPQSTPVSKRAAFVFLPPAAALIVGSMLISQASSAISNFEVLNKRRDDLAGEAMKVASLMSYQSTLRAIDSAQSELVVVNKHRPLTPATFEPELVVVPSSQALDNSRKLKLRPVASAALVEMAVAMDQQEMGQLFINSAYRSYDYQAELFVSKTKQYGLAGALLRSAKAGYSEHQTGLAADVSVPAQGCAILECFGETKAGKWIAENSWKYGFIIRYQKETTAITGYSYEPWHLRFIGRDLAEKYKEGDFQTLEAFWNLPAAPDYPIAESTSN